MVKTSYDGEQEFIAGINQLTGMDLAVWLDKISGSQLKDKKRIIDWLKSEFHFSHLSASLLAGIYLNKGTPVYSKRTK